MQLPALGYAAIISVAVPAATGAVRFRHLDRVLKILLSLQTIYMLVTAAQLYLALHDVRNLWLSHFYILIEYSLLMIVLSYWQDNQKVQNAIISSIIVFGLFWAVATIFLEPMTAPTIYTNPVGRTFYCIVGMWTLWHITKTSSTLILRDPRFWIVTALLISSTGDLMFYALRKTMISLSSRDIVIAWSIHWILAIITNLLYSVGYLWKPLTNSGGPSALAQ